MINSPKLRDLIRFGPPRYPQRDAWVRTPGVEPPTITINYRDLRYDWDLVLDPGPDLDAKIAKLQRRWEAVFGAQRYGS